MNLKLVIGLPLLLSYACSAATPTYTRSDCITKVQMLWSEETSFAERQGILKQLVDSISPLKGYTGPLPSISIRGEADQYIYLQYPDQCNRKAALTMNLFEDYLESEIDNFPDYSVTNEVVHPAMETICVFGPHWVDGKEGEPGTACPSE